VNGSATRLPNSAASPLPRRQLPQRNRDIRADDEPTSLVGGMQAAPDVVERIAEMHERIGLLVETSEVDLTRTHELQQLIAPPIDAGRRRRSGCCARQ
jgi:hypothetical protein